MEQHLKNSLMPIRYSQIMVNLLKTDSRLMKSYMGAEQLVAYRAFHGLETPGIEVGAKKDSD